MPLGTEVGLDPLC